MTLLHDAVAARVAEVWERDALPALAAYIRIPCTSPAFAPDWEQAGHLAAAFEHARAWVASRPVEALSAEVVRLPGLTPLLVAEVAATPGCEGAPPVVLYGHLDKQPGLTGWRDGLGPWEPVRDGDRLYGRGSADDGYAVFAALAAVEALQAAGGRHARLVVVVEGSEESGSPHLPAYVESLAGRIGSPDLVICLDSGCVTYDRLWVTTSLRGMVGGVLRVELLTEGVHSGTAGGAVPDTFRILRELVGRVEDAHTGELLLPELHVDIPPDRVAQARDAAADVGEDIVGRFPLLPGAALEHGSTAERLLRKTWGPALAVTGLDGAPPAGNAGNVVRPWTAAKLSFRLPPGCDPGRAAAAVERTLTADPPYGARVTFEAEEQAAGWAAPALAPWLDDAIERASLASFGRGARFVGEGGTIPFMAMLGQRFPGAQFLITGVLGPESNAHGPNEFLHVPTAEHVTAAVAHVLAAHAAR